MTQGDALHILQTGANVFLTGSPGSGKTHTVRAYIDWLRSHSIEPSITASTGVAATHIHGLTLHAWSGIGITDTFTPYEIDRIRARSEAYPAHLSAHNRRDLNAIWHDP
jgi:ATP-dependent DNA helicase PIF1